MGLVLLLLGLACLAMVPAAFVFNKKYEWILGLVICLPLGLIAGREGIVRLSRVCINFTQESITWTSRFSSPEIPWTNLAQIKLVQQNDDENRIFILFIGDDGKKITIRQGMFSIYDLDEMVTIIKEASQKHPTLSIDDSDGVLAGWDRMMEVYRKIRSR